MTDNLTIEQNLQNLIKTTDIILSANKEISQPNGWKLREILIHLWAWDQEMIKGCQAKISGKGNEFQFAHQKQNMDMNKWNIEIIKQKDSLSFAEAKKLFAETRQKTIDLFRKVIKMPETITDKESFLRNENLVRLWFHDKHHLEQADQKIKL
ncbi:MAG: hypothetical protein U9O98_01580 [Asgard group archaeon]|nr:hypothetical protein [Asgard group archaeon]